MTNTIYCTYLTVYSGNKLPPLYIGSTSVKNIEEGYHGSVSSKKYKQIWLSELSENPHLFETKILTTHSTREEAFEEEVRYQIEHNVVKSPEYINMAVANGKLMCNDYNDPKRNRKISEVHKGKKKSEETKKKLSESQKKRWEDPEERKKTSEANKKRFMNQEERKKISESLKGRKLSEEHKKNMSESMKNRYENQEERKKTSESMKGRNISEETKKKMSESQKKRWEFNRNNI